MVKLGRTIHAGFHSWRDAIGVIFIIAAVYGIVLGVISGITYSETELVSANMNALDTSSGSAFLDFTTLVKSVFTPSFYLFLGADIFMQTIGLLLILGFMLMFYQKKDQSASSGPQYKDIFSLFVCMFLILFFVGLGLILFIIPGIVIGVYLSLSVYAIVLRGKGPIDAMKYSYKLVTHNWWQTLGFLIMFSLVTMPIQLMFGLFLSFPIAGYIGLSPGIMQSALSSLVGGVVYILQITLVYSLAREYFISREKEEGFTGSNK